MWCFITLKYFSVPMFQVDYRFSNSSLEKSSFLAIQFLWTVLLIIFTSLHLCSVFILFIIVLFQVLFRCLLLDMLISRELRRGDFAYQVAYILCSVCGTGMPCMMLFLMCMKTFQLFIPIMGRAGSLVPPDLLIGGLMSLLVATCTPYLVS